MNYYCLTLSNRKKRKWKLSIKITAYWPRCVSSWSSPIILIKVITGKMKARKKKLNNDLNRTLPYYSFDSLIFPHLSVLHRNRKKNIRKNAKKGQDKWERSWKRLSWMGNENDGEQREEISEIPRLRVDKCKFIVRRKMKSFFIHVSFLFHSNFLSTWFVGEWSAC